MFWLILSFLPVIVGVMIIILSEPAFARKKFSGFSFKGKPTAYKSNNKIMSAGFSIIGAQGTMGNGLDDAPDRDMYFYPVQLFVGVRMSDSYRLEKPDINDNLQAYKATAGYTAQYTRRLRGRLGFVLDYSQEEFSESLDTGPVKWTRTGFGLIFSNFDQTSGK